MLLQSFAPEYVLAQPVLNKVLITDVSDRSFSLIYTSNEPGDSNLAVYSDPEGLNKVPNYNVVTYPVNTGTILVLTQNQFEAKQQIIDKAKALGVVKVAVTGLNPDSQYYVKYGFMSGVSQESTLCPDSGVLFCPESNNVLVSVKTNKQQTRNHQVAGIDIIFTNDNLFFYNEKIVLGELIVLAVENTRYPITVFAGDGMPLPYIQFDMNNITTYDQQFTYVVHGLDVKASGNIGEGVLVRRYRGLSDDTTELGVIGVVRADGSLVEKIDRSIADCNADGVVNGYDSLLLQKILTSNISTKDYTNIGFHSILCNLYKEEGLNSVITNVNLDASDFDRLSDVLVGKTQLNSLPESP